MAAGPLPSSPRRQVAARTYRSTACVQQPLVRKCDGRGRIGRRWRSTTRNPGGVGSTECLRRRDWTRRRGVTQPDAVAAATQSIQVIPECSEDNSEVLGDLLGEVASSVSRSRALRDSDDVDVLRADGGEEVVRQLQTSRISPDLRGEAHGVGRAVRALCSAPCRLLIAAVRLTEDHSRQDRCTARRWSLPSERSDGGRSRFPVRLAATAGHTAFGAAVGNVEALDQRSWS